MTTPQTALSLKHALPRRILSQCVHIHTRRASQTLRSDFLCLRTRTRGTHDLPLTPTQLQRGGGVNGLNGSALLIRLAPTSWALLYVKPRLTERHAYATYVTITDEVGQRCRSSVMKAR